MAVNLRHYRALDTAPASGNPRELKPWIALLGALSVGLSSGVARAQSADAEASASTSLAAEAADPGGGGRGFRTNYLEFGFFLGALFPSKKHNLVRNYEDFGRERFGRFAGEAGLRLAYFPIAFVGAEIEGMGGLGRTANTHKTALFWALRAHGVLQYPAVVTPFVLVGGGRFGAKSDVTGGDGDPLFHFGGGLKFPVSDLLGIRVDVRDNLTQKYNAEGGKLTHHVEATLGLGFSFDLSSKPAPIEPPAPPPDTDRDGVLDPNDRCPAEPGPAPEGCPLPGDADGDGFTDDKDLCPNVSGIAPDGCPDPDPDSDGIKGAADHCPNEPGIEPDGCPDPDPDKDGVIGDADKCPKEPETKNGFEDADGCPDTLPERVKKYAGVIPGIEFDLGKSTIRPGSRYTLDDAVRVLKEYPSLRISISGHTDDTGNREKNIVLSRARAEAVKSYLVGSGIEASRLETRGAGPDEPIAENTTKAGRQKNRRIEFKLISQ